MMAALAVAAVALMGSVPREVADAVNDFGAAAPAVFVVLYVGLSLLLVPSSVLTLTAGLLFGIVPGASLAFVSGALSAAVGFFVGRRFGRARVERLAGARLEVVNRWLRRHGVVTVAIARNVPALPFGLVNYAAGVTGIPARRFLVGTLLGFGIGALVVYGGLSSLVATLATRELFRGLAVGINSGKEISLPGEINQVWEANFLGLPLPLIVLVLLFAITYLIVHHTWMGRMLFAIGDNREAARFAAVPVRKSLDVITSDASLAAASIQSTRRSGS